MSQIADIAGAKAAAEKEAEKQRKEKERQQRYDAPIRMAEAGDVFGHTMEIQRKSWTKNMQMPMETN